MTKPAQIWSRSSVLSIEELSLIEVRAQWTTKDFCDKLDIVHGIFNPKCPIELFTPPILLKLTGNTPNGLTYHCVE